MDLLNCITDDIKHATMIIWRKISLFMFLTMFPLFLKFLVILTNTQIRQIR